MNDGIGAGNEVSKVHTSARNAGLRVPMRFTASVVGNSEASDDRSFGVPGRRESPCAR